MSATTVSWRCKNDSTGLVHYNTEEANKFVHLKTRVKMSFFLVYYQCAAYTVWGLSIFVLSDPSIRIVSDKLN